MAEPPYTTFTKWQKLSLVVIASLSASFSGFASNIYFPAIPIMATSLSTSIENINLTVTSYMIFQAITPTFWGAISDAYGRRLVLISTLVVFFSACIGLALIEHYYQLVILRCLQSTGSASTIAIGSGIIGDVADRKERGSYMGFFQTGLLLPLAIGPVLGGIFAQTLGWRAIFWFFVIYAGIFLIILAIFLPETLRRIVGNGAICPPARSRTPLERFLASRDKTLPPVISAAPIRPDWIAPLRILFVPDVFLALFFLSLHYATWQMAITAQSSLFKNIYNLSEIEIGLTFIANGFGCMLGTLSIGRFLDYDYQRFKKKISGPASDFPIEQARLRTVWFWSPFQCAAVLWFGWTLDQKVHMASPIAASFVLAWAAMSIQAVISTFIVDIFPKSSASATAALNLARCLMGAGATASVEPSINTLGVGFTFTLWACLMALSLTFVGVQMHFGPAWRKRREKKLEEKEKG
ncbi:hypothetical protein C366_03785 [Cryptococcus neoformans Tu401-1]|nr:hypothetical protein AYX15_02615 [Cryptococcus neoformans var. grubii]OXG16989.1 hypothetical protein C366_03785 [Cryptococcus neoformans var. grubii Tu401-1]OXM78598.1 hypothetical protein C364_03763 [Cryptococcus neoformans var. grubii Bt63]